MRDGLTNLNSQARVDQAQLTRNTDQCLAENLAQATKESLEREVRMTREIERLLNYHDNTYAHRMTSMEKRLDAKSDLMMRKLDEILNGGNREERSTPRERSHQANDGDRARGHAAAQPSSRSNLIIGSDPGQPHRGQVGQTRLRRKRIPPPPPETRLPTVPQVRSVPDLTTVSQDTAMYAPE